MICRLCDGGEAIEIMLINRPAEFFEATPLARRLFPKQTGLDPEQPFEVLAERLHCRLLGRSIIRNRMINPLIVLGFAVDQPGGARRTCRTIPDACLAVAY